METQRRKEIWPWILVGCGLLVILACMFAAAAGMGGALIASRVVRGIRAERESQPAERMADAAILQDLQGWVEVLGETGAWSPAEEGQAIFAGQGVRTGQLSSASLSFADGSRADLKAGAEIVIEELDAPEGGETRTIVMFQSAGVSSHHVATNNRPDSRYEVLTHSGSGTAKGTAFQVIVIPQQATYFYVLEGAVAVSGLETTVLINPGFMTILFFNQPPLAPVETISVEGIVSQTGGEWVVAGTTFTVNDGTLVSGSPQVGDWVVVKGHLDEAGQNVADWIVLLRRAVTNRFSLTGVVESIEPGLWTVNGQAIVVEDALEYDSEIAVSDTVYVQGVIDPEGILRATRITLLDDEAGLPFAFTGIVETVRDGEITISGILVMTDDGTTLPEDLSPGDLVRVEGRIQPDGGWLARKITLETETGSEFSFTGELEDKDPWTVAGITFEVSPDADMPGDLEPGELVRVEGFIDDSGTWIATRIERVEVEGPATMVLIGTVVTVNPWVVSGISLTLAPDAEVGEEILPGMLVRVVLELQPDGTWLVVKIEPLDDLVWFPGCLDVIATVVSVNGSQLQLLNWPVVTIAEGAAVEGVLTPNSVIRMRVCFDEAMVIHVVYIVIIDPGDEVPGEIEFGEKVLICHKPGGKKGGNTLNISRSALPAHLAHGDTLGPCR